MALEIKWSVKADFSLDELIEYLELEWSEKVVHGFMQKLYDFLDVLQEFPEIGSMQYPQRDIRGFVLTKQITVFYKVENEQIILLDFFDNRSNPVKKNAL